MAVLLVSLWLYGNTLVLTKTVIYSTLEGQRALAFHQKYLNLCADKLRTLGFGTTWGWVFNDKTLSKACCTKLFWVLGFYSGKFTFSLSKLCFWAEKGVLVRITFCHPGNLHYFYSRLEIAKPIWTNQVWVKWHIWNHSKTPICSKLKSFLSQIVFYC